MESATALIPPSMALNGILHTAESQYPRRPIDYKNTKTLYQYMGGKFNLIERQLL